VVRAAVIPATTGSALWFMIKDNVLVACGVVAITDGMRYLRFATLCRALKKILS